MAEYSSRSVCKGLKRVPLVFCVLLVCLAFLINSCAVNPVSKKREFVLMSEGQEIAIGKQQDPIVLEEFGYYEDEKLQEYVNRVGQRIAEVSDRPDLIYRYKVVNSEMVNAFALPGGYIYMTRGILSHLNSEAELATVLGHETGHVTARHAVQQITKSRTLSILQQAGSIFVPQLRQVSQLTGILFQAILSGYGRQAEFQSDEVGMKYAIEAGYDPRSAAEFLKTLKSLEKDQDKGGFHGFFASHPETADRIQRAQEIAQGLLSSEEPHRTLLVDRNEYLRHLDGMLYGPDPKEGVTIGNIFRHKDMAFEITFPMGWEIHNTKNALISKEPEKEHIIQMLSPDDLSKRITPEEYAKGFTKKGKMKVSSGEAADIHGMKAYIAQAETSLDKLGKVGIEYAVIFKENQAFNIVSFAPLREFPEVKDAFLSTIHSFRRLTHEERKAIKPMRLKILEAKAGDTLEMLVKKHGVEGQRVEEIAKMNGLDPKQALEVGMKVKLIVSF